MIIYDTSTIRYRIAIVSVYVNENVYVYVYDNVIVYENVYVNVIENVIVNEYENVLFISKYFCILGIEEKNNRFFISYLLFLVLTDIYVQILESTRFKD